jgi:hypothetical protein
MHDVDLDLVDRGRELRVSSRAPLRCTISRALRAASRARDATTALLMMFRASLGCGSRYWPSLSETTVETAVEIIWRTLTTMNQLLVAATDLNVSPTAELKSQNAELAAGVQHGHHDLGRRPVLGGHNVDT